jgi:DNA-binding NarL/FixJ family response regulator
VSILNGACPGRSSSSQQEPAVRDRIGARKISPFADFQAEAAERRALFIDDGSWSERMGMSERERIRLMIVEDQHLIREAFVALLEQEPDMEVAASAADGAEAIAAARAFRPDVVLMDIKMPRLDGLAATRAIMAENPLTRVIVLTTFETDALVFEAILAGARAYLLKDAPPEEILSAIRGAARGETRLSPSVAGKILDEFRRLKTKPQADDIGTEPLTERERAVLAHVADGKGNREIARQLGLAEGTVKNHVSTILSKLHLRSRTELAVRAQSMR